MDGKFNFYGLAVVFVVILAVLFVGYGWAVYRRSKRFSKVVKAMRRVNDVFKPMFFLTTAPFKVVGIEKKEVQILEDEPYKIDVCDLHTQSQLPSLGFQAVVGTILKSVSEFEVESHPEGLFCFVFVPADNVHSVWKVRDFVGTDARLTHPVMGVLRLKSPTRQLKVGEVVMLKQTVKKVKQTFLLEYHLC